MEYNPWDPVDQGLMLRDDFAGESIIGGVLWTSSWFVKISKDAKFPSVSNLEGGLLKRLFSPENV